ncbi:MAG: alpha,2-mannosidase [Pedosphaera sp.]|nr:alpha,2-mannosidase [Pedosphaera sp.]
MKTILIALILIGLSALSSCPGAIPQPVDEILPLIGTGGHGHTYPGATVPFGFVQLSPDTPIKGWDAWQYTFAVFHDVPSMIKLYRGDEAFIKKTGSAF